MRDARREDKFTVEVTTKPSDECPHHECDGTGSISVISRPTEQEFREIGNGVSIGPPTSYATRLCRCRAELEPRAGDASWWTSEVVYESSWRSSVLQHEAGIAVSAEVPISEDNYRVVRHGNRYYPTTIDVDFSEDWLHSLFPDEARELAAMLVAAADAADAIDKPDTTATGVWA